MLWSPVLPRGADVVFVGEKHCGLRFLDGASRLPGLFDQIRRNGSEPGLIVPGRLPEGQLDSVLAVVSELKGKVRRVISFDPGLARALSNDFDVTIAGAAHSVAGIRETILSTGASGFLPLHFPLPRYVPTSLSTSPPLPLDVGGGGVRNGPLPLGGVGQNGAGRGPSRHSGFPDVPIDLHVFGRLTVSGGVFCLTRFEGHCPGRSREPVLVEHPYTRLLVSGNSIYSWRTATAHLIRDRILALPLRGLVFDTMGQGVEVVEQAIRFWKGEGDFPALDPDTLCNGMYVSDLWAPAGKRVRWDCYLPELDRYFG